MPEATDPTTEPDPVSELEPSVLDAYEADRSADRERIARLEAELEQAPQRAQAPGVDPIEARFQEARQRAADLDDAGLMRNAYAERDAARDAQAEAEAARRRAAADDELMRDYDAETARLAASDDEDERAASERRQHDRPRQIQLARDAAFSAEVDQAWFDLVDNDPHLLAGGYLGDGKHVDDDPWVRAAKRNLGELERSEADPRDIERQRQAIDDRIAELRDNPDLVGHTPGNQAVPGSDAQDPQTLAARIAAAEREAMTTNDWTEFNRLQTEALLRSGS
jgi:hypothetical protein